jgi:hypothetical protein
MKTEKEILELKEKYSGNITEEQVSLLTNILLYDNLLSDQEIDQGGQDGLYTLLER